MSQRWPWLFGLVSLGIGTVSAQSVPDAQIQTTRSAPVTEETVERAPDWRRDIWHYVIENTPFFTEERRTLHSAGVLQSNGRFALLLLGTADQGALVSVNVPGNAPAEVLVSDLVMPSGNVLSRKVTQDQLLAMEVPGSQSYTYSFRIAPADLELFMGALRWRVVAGENSVDLTLKGSRKAISEAINHRDAPTALSETSD